MNILILIAGQAITKTSSTDYPLCLSEVDGIPLIERIIECCLTIDNANFIICMLEEDIQKYHLDNIARLLMSEVNIIRIKNPTAGAACTALLSAKYIDNNEELLILNGNELLLENFEHIIQRFRSMSLDAGSVVFSSIHPRYSYVKLNEKNLVVEAAEKRPISKNATTGFYWYKEGKRFVRAVKSMIRKDESTNNLFYICPTFNELILENAKIGVFHTSKEKYQPFKTERQFIQYETR